MKQTKDEFPLYGVCEKCGASAIPLIKYKGAYYCKLCLQEEKDREKSLSLQKKRDNVRADFLRWNT